ncbi:helix-turn-helix domain-containing protein [Nitratireductor sp. XY-223]|uniref:winged helix-turn-helix transcriptional regulator n=1 Tax=Nitratireductor sp. XY-223 TaxID=2561926 RepID=UPI0010A9FB31|nr:helix-turn-helix domain-containing protein [Nitratireductor sp. XY-223]
MDERGRELVDQVETLMKVIGAKWKPAIMFCLVFGGRQRFSELRRQLPDITQRMLTLRLREMERDGLVHRTYHEEVPPRVEYEVTELGRSLHPFYKSLCDWGQEHAQAIKAANGAYRPPPKPNPYA